MCICEKTVLNLIGYDLLFYCQNNEIIRDLFSALTCTVHEKKRGPGHTLALSKALKKQEQKPA